MEEKLIVNQISPIMSPLTGANISISGNSFRRNMKVFVENIECEFAFINENSILIQSPPNLNQGPKDLKLKSGKLN